MLAILLAAGVGLVHHPTTVEGRISLLEARQMLESQQVWQLRAELPSEALKTISDVQLHVQHDQEQEDKVRDLTQTVQLLEHRLAALEIVLQEKSAPESMRIPVAPMQLQALEVPPSKAAARKSKHKQAAPPHKMAHKQNGRARATGAP
jgi:hypothetical protein